MTYMRSAGIVTTGGYDGTTPTSETEPNMSAGTAGGFGPWLELIAATAEDLYIVGHDTQGGGSPDATIYEFGVGAAGSEVSVAQFRPAGTTEGPFFFPIPVFVPAGSRIAVRKSETGTGSAPRVLTLKASGITSL